MKIDKKKIEIISSEFQVINTKFITGEKQLKNLNTNESIAFSIGLVGLCASFKALNNHLKKDKK